MRGFQYLLNLALLMLAVSSASDEDVDDAALDDGEGEEDMGAFLSHLDSNSDGKLSLDELFIAGDGVDEDAELTMDSWKDHATRAFERADENKDGGIDMEELPKLMEYFEDVEDVDEDGHDEDGKGIETVADDTGF
mmetsp:Transcript_8924/g.23193  ORF Transcript_8924/g.23193 Transcript_8924/m.23193 type:complete len:136 (+) Transcript_8924:97-504(+)|eukprot:CAMPEP_0117581616 /NCGR_PEP_ID=MMETSP0784-20121206/65932_1 /TAXON_ID=39447 /ORGANISM="" /LENGTH=135 /DNA_ID=CAMNT_0005381959 /DNA_START=96 /DNA_END=503 /DNA_ORIENTATION=+